MPSYFGTRKKREILGSLRYDFSGMMTDVISDTLCISPDIMISDVMAWASLGMLGVVEFEEGHMEAGRAGEEDWDEAQVPMLGDKT